MAKTTPKPETTAADAAPANPTEPTAAAVEAGAIDAEETAAANSSDAPRLVRARVLAFCALGAPNDVIEIDADQVKTVGDVIDTDPAAVAYAESLKV